MKPAGSKEQMSCEDLAMGRENIKIMVFSLCGIRPPKLSYPRTYYFAPKYISQEEYDSKFI